MNSPPEGQRSAIFRFYAELNDFLPASRSREREYPLHEHCSVGHALANQGVPLSAIELILVNGKSVSLEHRLKAADRVAVFPTFETFDVRPLLRLREAPLRRCRFICDVQLGRLARWLRLIGFDAAYRNTASPAEIIAAAEDEHRIILTRSRRLLAHDAVKRGCLVRSEVPAEQIADVVERLQLHDFIAPFLRCLECNGALHRVPTGEVFDQVEPKTREHFDTFFQCESCRRVYWRGSHHEHMVRRLRATFPTLVSVDTATQ